MSLSVDSHANPKTFLDDHASVNLFPEGNGSLRIPTLWPGSWLLTDLSMEACGADCAFTFGLQGHEGCCTPAEPVALAAGRLC